MIFVVFQVTGDRVLVCRVNLNRHDILGTFVIYENVFLYRFHFMEFYAYYLIFSHKIFRNS